MQEVNETPKATMYTGTEGSPDYVCLLKAGSILILAKPLFGYAGQDRVMGLRIRAVTENGMPMPTPESGLFMTDLPWTKMDAERFSFEMGALKCPSSILASAKDALRDKLITGMLEVRELLRSKIQAPLAVTVEDMLPVEYIVDAMLDTVNILEPAAIPEGSNVVELKFPEKATGEYTVKDDDEDDDEDDQDVY